jgi:hypothetical protein
MDLVCVQFVSIGKIFLTELHPDLEEKRIVLSGRGA